MARAKQVKSLDKVKARITKKKGASGARALHENSRDARSLGRAVAREEKLSKMQAVRQSTVQPYLERVAFFQDVQQGHSTSPLSLPEIQEAIESYIARDEDDLETLESERRPGRPPHPRLVALQHQNEADEKEYTSGYWIPDLQDEETLKVLRIWKGEWTSLQLLKFVRVARDGTVRESKFPPKGGS